MGFNLPLMPTFIAFESFANCASRKNPKQYRFPNLA
jgi:hypothetical protein